MLDQSFSPENFRKIIEIENRKGIYLEGMFFPEIEKVTQLIKACNTELRLLKKKVPKNEYDLQKGIIIFKRELLKKQKEELYKGELLKISENVTSNKYSIKLIKDENILDKPIYKTQKGLNNILVLKQLQYNFKKLYKVKQSSRYSIVSQLKNILEDKSPKIIIRTDLKGFYESIPQKTLLDKLNNENLLTKLSRRFVSQTLREYNNLSGTNIGVPRGIGISPYLTELYMRDVDSRLKGLPEIIYYARYVDDIVLVFSPQTNTTKRNYIDEIKNIIEIENGLSLNKDKTQIFDLQNALTKPINCQLEYLGYKYSFGSKINSSNNIKPDITKVTISRKKKRKYAFRISEAIRQYQQKSKLNEKKARALFTKRIKFLTSNTRLVNNKKHVLTGIYFTNSLINDTTDLTWLDLYLKRLLKQKNIPASLLKAIITKHSFEKGFLEKRFSQFKPTDLNNIMRNW